MATEPGGTLTGWVWALEEMRWRRAFPGTLDQVPVARRFAGAMFEGSPCADVVEYAVAELAGNALRHSDSAEKGGWFGVELVHDDPVHVAVTDIGGKGVPAVRDCVDEFAESGRGLHMLSRFAISLGVHGSAGKGHTVWVDLDLEQSLEALLERELPDTP
ncbi:ATP-binding protein [Spirillospora sp. NPDC052269]